jgi:hypothetical protein
MQQVSPPIAPHTRLQDHSLPPNEWGSPLSQNKSFAEGGDYWNAINEASSISRTEQFSHSLTSTVVSCEGFLMQKVSVPKTNKSSAYTRSSETIFKKNGSGSGNSSGDGNGNGNGSVSMLTWQQRYMWLNPEDLTLTIWNIPPGKVVVSRPKTRGEVINISCISSVNAWVGKNKTRFDLVITPDKNNNYDLYSTMASTVLAGITTEELTLESKNDRTPALLSLMADTPEDCSRWVAAIKMVIAAVQTSSSATSSTSSSVNNDTSKLSNDSLSESLGTTWEQVKISIQNDIEKDPNLIGAILYGMPAFFQAVDRDGMGLISLHEFEQGMIRLGIPLTKESIYDLNIISNNRNGNGANNNGNNGNNDQTAVIAYGEVVEQLTSVAVMVAGSSDLNISIGNSNNDKNTTTSATTSDNSKSSTSTGSNRNTATSTSIRRHNNNNNTSNRTPTKTKGESRMGTRESRVGNRVGRDRKLGREKSDKSLTKTRTKSSVQSPTRSPVKGGKKSNRRKLVGKNRMSSTKSKNSNNTSIDRPLAMVRKHNIGRSKQKVHLRLPAAKQNDQNDQNEEMSERKESSFTTSPKKKRRGGRTTSYARPWATKSSKSKTTKVDLNRVQLLAPRTTNTSSEDTVADDGSDEVIFTKEEASRREKLALHSALSAAQKLVAKETRLRLEAEKNLAIEKSNNIKKKRISMTEQSERDEINAKNLDKLHVMYGKQIEKLRTMLELEGNQLANAREEIAEMTLSRHKSGGTQLNVTNKKISNTSTSKTIQSAADLILLDRLAKVEEKYNNTCDQLKMLTEEKKVMTENVNDMKRQKDVIQERMKNAENLVKELRRALTLSKEESTILESERQRLLKENSILTKGKRKKPRYFYFYNCD